MICYRHEASRYDVESFYKRIASCQNDMKITPVLKELGDQLADETLSFQEILNIIEKSEGVVTKECFQDTFYVFSVRQMFQDRKKTGGDLDEFWDNQIRGLQEWETHLLQQRAEALKIQEMKIKNIDETKDFTYFLFKSYFRLEEQNDGWVTYRDLCDDMEKQDYASAFVTNQINDLLLQYATYYISLDIFDERYNELHGGEIKLNECLDANSIRQMFDILNLPIEIYAKK